MEDWDNVGMKEGREQEAKKSLEQKGKETLNFFRRAFCIDGDCKIVKPNNLKVVACVEMNDSKRGKFYVGILEAKNENTIN